MTPVTIKQLHQCQNIDSTFTLDNAELFTVKIIGQIESIEDHATNQTYQISDTTGIIECKLWIDKDASSSNKHNLRPNDLVKICGNLREYEGRRHVLIYDISPVLDWNEMTHHFLGKHDNSM